MSNLKVIHTAGIGDKAWEQESRAKRNRSRDIVSSFEENLIEELLVIGKLKDWFEDLKKQIDLVEETFRDKFSATLNRLTDPMH